MKVFTIINPESISNVYFITDARQKVGVIIDPGSFSLTVYKEVKKIGARITKILVTSSDKSHISGIPVIKKIYEDAEIFAHNIEVCDFTTKQIKTGDVIKEGDFKIKVIDTPIYSYDSLSFLVDDALFTGNILEAGSLSSLNKDGNPAELELDVIKKYFVSLPDSTIIYPGRGPATTIGIEKKFNSHFKKVIDNNG